MAKSVQTGMSLTAEGCAARRTALWNAVPGDVDTVVLSSPEHVLYFSNFWAPPFVFNSQNGTAVLLLRRDQPAVLITDNVQETAANAAHGVTLRLPVWYSGQTAAGNRRETVMAEAQSLLVEWKSQRIAAELSSASWRLLTPAGSNGSEYRPVFSDVGPLLLQLRRKKHADELALLRASIRAGVVGQIAAQQILQPGVSERDVWREITAVTSAELDQQSYVYGDFVSGLRCEAGGGPPSDRKIAAGELFILDFSVLLRGYRGDFCNTFCVAGEPGPELRRMEQTCMQALSAGETTLRAGAAASDVDAAVRSVFVAAGLGAAFRHHTGHGIGLGHPESPFFVPKSDEALLAGEVVTIEPGAYVAGVGGMRFERNYLITDTGFELLSDHPLGLTPGR